MLLPNLSHLLQVLDSDQILIVLFEYDLYKVLRSNIEVWVFRNVELKYKLL